jgi:hypothetical protein
MILDVVLWLPIKVAQHFFKPVTKTFESLAELSNEELDKRFDSV